MRSTPLKRQPSLAPDTTAQQDSTQDLKFAGQRRINLIWETTQAVLAIGITASVIWNETHGLQSNVLTNAFFLIVSMYLVRTNHSMTGGVGTKPPSGESR